MIRTVAGRDWSVGYTFDHQTGMTTLGASRMGDHRRRGELDGAVFARGEDARSAALGRGYTEVYPGRNSIRFLQSRAARRRGHVCNDPIYNMVARQYQNS